MEKTIAAESDAGQILRELEAIFRHASIGIAFTHNRQITRCNAALEEVLGYGAGELNGVPSGTIFTSSEDYAQFAGKVRALLALGEPVRLNWNFRQRDGQAVTCKVSAKAVNPSPVDEGTVWLFEDISRSLLQSRALARTMLEFEAIMNNAPIGIVFTADRRVTRCNAHACQMFGYTQDQLIGRPGRHLFVCEEDYMALGRVAEPLLSCGLSFAHETPLARRDGSTFWAQLVGYGVNPADTAQGTIWLISDRSGEKAQDEAIQQAHELLEDRVARRTTKLAETNQRLQQEIAERRQIEEAMRCMAHFDALTGLPNRNLLNDRMEQALARAKRYKERVGVLFIDLDHFKTINDSLGHQIGDMLLAQVASRMAYALRETDTLGRLGGDEFLLLVPEAENSARLASVAEKLIEVLSQPILIQSHVLHITPSIGICCYPEHGEDCETLMRNADTAMYHAKSCGRNTYKFFVNRLNEEVDKRFQIETALRYAVDQHELELYYQPLMDGASRRIRGMEALLRWNSKALGPMLPAEFIPLAEESGAIVPMGAWVLREACLQMRQWHDLGHRELVLAVNLSPQQFRQSDLVQMIGRVLEETGYPAQALELEITESSLMHSISEVISTLRQLVALGVRLSIDDFGTGYSSLAYLKHFPVHKLKIDRSFVRDMGSDQQSVGIVATIVALANTLHLDVLAEGVESESQRATLRDLGCHDMQGFLFFRPMPADRMSEILKAGNDPPALE
jgi:diguanylate cyclase (GGDEF)-like protein/PAS domain S-box-containing protein